MVNDIHQNHSGRLDNLKEDDYNRYWNESKESRQNILRELYNKRDGFDPYATSRDYNQRELEILAIKRNLSTEGKIVDLGCGNGYSLISLAKEFKNWPMIGIDFSENLIKGAHQLLEHNKDSLLSIPEFICEDALKYIKETPNESVNYFITERFLLNLPTKDTQFDTIKDIYRALTPGGRLIMCEGSMDGFNGLNTLRTQVGLDPIPETSTENLSSIRFRDKELEEFITKEVGFKLVNKLGFSTFFAISRALYPLYIAPETPQFDSKINDLAREIQNHLPFEPGIGSNVLWILDKPQI